MFDLCQVGTTDVMCLKENQVFTDIAHRQNSKTDNRADFAYTFPNKI